MTFSNFKKLVTIDDLWAGALSCNKLTYARPICGCNFLIFFRKVFSFYRKHQKPCTSWNSDLHDRAYVSKTYGVQYLFCSYSSLGDSRSFSTFSGPCSIVNFTLRFIKMNPCFVTSDDICKRPCIVIWILFKQQFSALHACLYLLICQQMGIPSSTDLSQITFENGMSCSL